MERADLDVAERAALTVFVGAATVTIFGSRGSFHGLDPDGYAVMFEQFLG